MGGGCGDQLVELQCFNAALVNDDMLIDGYLVQIHLTLWVVNDCLVQGRSNSCWNE